MTTPAALSSVLLVLLIPGVGSSDVSTPPGQADSAAAANQSRFVLKLDRLIVDNMRLDDTMLLTLETSGIEVAGFSFRTGQVSRYLSITEILPGELLDSCKWEFFRAMPVAGADPLASIDQVWSVTALAKTTPDTSSTRCLGLGRPSSLLKLVVSNEGISQVPDHFEPIFFFWENCRDNVLSSADGRLMAVSATVFDDPEIEMPESTNGFPSVTGTPPS